MRICLPAVPRVCQQSIIVHQILYDSFRYEDRSAFLVNAHLTMHFLSLILSVGPVKFYYMAINFIMKLILLYGAYHGY